MVSFLPSTFQIQEKVSQVSSFFYISKYPAGSGQASGFESFLNVFLMPGSKIWTQPNPIPDPWPCPWLSAPVSLGSSMGGHKHLPKDMSRRPPAGGEATVKAVALIFCGFVPCSAESSGGTCPYLHSWGGPVFPRGGRRHHGGGLDEGCGHLWWHGRGSSRAGYAGHIPDQPHAAVNSDVGVALCSHAQHLQAIVVKAWQLALKWPPAVATTNSHCCLGVENR